MFIFVVFILQSFLHCACSDYNGTSCVSNATGHSGCLLTENNTCSTECINPKLYEATGDNKRCIAKACTAYDATTCSINDACVVTETSKKCASACEDFKVFLPVDGKCVESKCETRRPKTMTVSITVTHVKFSYNYKTNNSVGVTVMGIQKNSSFYNTNGNSSLSDFEYDKEGDGFVWENVPDESLKTVRIQVYTDKQYFIGHAYIDITDYKTVDGINITKVYPTGNITEPDQPQNVTLVIGVCTSCGSSIWPCGDNKEEVLCYQDLEKCGLSCTSTNDAHYTADLKTGICVRDCKERKNSGENQWPCGNNFETTPCYAISGGGDGNQECSTECSQGWYKVNNSSGTCELKECEQRVAVPGGKQPCGDNTKCYYDQTKPTDHDVLCLSSCPKTNLLSGIADPDGVCALKACADRTPEVTASHPCGSVDCVYNEDKGICGLADCVDRVPSDDNGSPYPCESDDCFWDSAAAAESGRQCVTECPKDDTHTGEVENGECVVAVITRGGETSWWDGPKILGLPRMWFVIIAAAVALLLLLIIIIIIVIVVRRKNKKTGDGYQNIND